MSSPAVRLASVTVDLPSPGQVVSIGDSPSGPEDPCVGKGLDVCSPVCLSLADLLVTQEVRVTVSVDTDLPASDQLWIAGRSIISPVLCSIPETLMRPDPKNACRREASVSLDGRGLIDAGVDLHEVSWAWSWRPGS